MSKNEIIFHVIIAFVCLNVGFLFVNLLGVALQYYLDND